MSGDGLQCAVQLANATASKTFYVSGETIRGSLVLKAAHRTKLVSKVTGSLICEEWVHTTQLEFKEHFHSNSKMFDVTRNPIEIRPGHPATVAFELVLPEDEDLKLPPSFDFKHNNVVWKTKFLVEHQDPESSDVGIVQAEQPFRLCRYSSKHKPDLEPQNRALTTHTRHVVSSDFSLSNKIADRSEAAIKGISDLLAHGLGSEHGRKTDLKDLKDLELDLVLRVPAYGLVQTPCDDGPTLGLRLEIDAQRGGLRLHEVALDLVKSVVTAGSPYEDVKPITRVRENCVVKAGANDFTRYLSRVRLSGFTETFETEWQQLSQRLRITLSFTKEPAPPAKDSTKHHLSLAPALAKEGHANSHVLKLPWEIPVTVLSEAYGC